MNNNESATRTYHNDETTKFFKLFRLGFTEYLRCVQGKYREAEKKKQQQQNIVYIFYDNAWNVFAHDAYKINWVKYLTIKWPNQRILLSLHKQNDKCAKLFWSHFLLTQWSRALRPASLPSIRRHTIARTKKVFSIYIYILTFAAIFSSLVRFYVVCICFSFGFGNVWLLAVDNCIAVNNVMMTRTYSETQSANRFLFNANLPWLTHSRIKFTVQSLRLINQL